MPPCKEDGDRATLGERLYMARKAKGWSTRSVAERIRSIVQISHATLANYEKDATRPPIGVVAALAALYEYPINWFLGDGPVLRGVRYRSLKSKVGVRAKLQFEGESQRWLDAYIAIEQFLDEPLSNEHTNIRELRCKERESPRELALRLREKLNLREDEAIVSVQDILDQFGIRTIEIETNIAIDGLAARLGNEHAIVLSHHVSNDRLRMNALHELGYILNDDCKTDAREIKEDENAAFEFASFALLTSPMLRAAFRRKSMVDLVRYKERFGISLAAMVYRAQEQGVLRADEAKRLWIAFAKRGWRQTEPGNVIADRPVRFESLIAYAIEEKGHSYKSIANVVGVREDELKRRVDLVLDAEEFDQDGENDQNNTDRLRLVR